MPLTADEYTFIRFGPDPRWPDAFANRRALRKAWKAHREHLMAIPAPGHRPWAFWELEVAADIDFPGYDKEPETLLRLSLLSEAEKAELFAEAAPSAKPAA